MRAVLLGLALAALALAGIARLRAAEDRRRHPELSSRRPRAPASTASMPASGNTWSAAASPPSTATATAFADMLLAGGASPAKFYRNASTRGGALQIRGRDQRPRTGQGDRRLSARHRQRRHHRSRAAARRRKRRDARPRRLPVRARQRGLGLRRRRCLVDRACRDLGARRRLADDRDRQLHRPPRGDVALGILHRQLAAPAGSADGRARGFAAPLPLKPSFCPLSMLFTDWNRSGTPSLRVSNDREYYEGGQEQLWHVEPGKAPALYTADEGWKFLRIWGMGIASYDLNFDGYPEYFLTSMADNKLQTLAAVPQDGAPQARPTPTSPSPRASPRTVPTPAATGSPAPPGTRSSRTSTMTAWSICSSPRAMSPRCRTSPMKDPNNLLLQQQRRQVPGSGRQGRHRQLRQSRAAPRLPISTWTACSTWSSSTAGKARSSGATPARMPAAGSRSSCSSRPRTATRSAHGSRSRCGRHGDAPRNHRRRRPCRRPDAAGGISGWATPLEAEVRVIWPDGQRSDWQAVDGNNFYILERGKPAQKWAAEVTERLSQPVVAAAIAPRGSMRRYATSFPAFPIARRCPGAKICWSRKVSARMAQPSRMSGISLGSVSKEMALLCWPPAVWRSPRGSAVPVGRRRARHADKGDGRGVDQRKQAAQPEAERLAGLAEGFALRARQRRARLRRQAPHVGVADVGTRAAESSLMLPRIAPDRIVAGIGLDAAAPAAAAERAVRAVDHVAEFAAGRLRAGEQLALAAPVPCRCRATAGWR